MSTTANSQPEHDDQAHAPLPLPPPQEDGAHKLNIGSEMKFDTLGPLVVNSDGVSVLLILPLYTDRTQADHLDIIPHR